MTTRFGSSRGRVFSNRILRYLFTILWRRLGGTKNGIHVRFGLRLGVAAQGSFAVGSWLRCLIASLASAVFFCIYCRQQSEFLAVRSAADVDARSSRTHPKSRLVGANCSECIRVSSYVLTDLGDRRCKKGTVKWFNPTKGYGFIRPTTGDKDVFVHISAVERAGLSALNEGQVVEYEVVTNRGKTSAENLKVA